MEIGLERKGFQKIINLETASEVQMWITTGFKIGENK
jgi:hypothetical protein